MTLELGEQNLDKFIMVGDRVLVKPKSPVEKTKSGPDFATRCSIERKNSGWLCVKSWTRISHSSHQ
jgi:chaperonin GroES